METHHDIQGLMSTGSLRDMEAGEEAKAMDSSPKEQEAPDPEAPAIEEPPSPPREGKCADPERLRGLSGVTQPPCQQGSDDLGRMT